MEESHILMLLPPAGQTQITNRYVIKTSLEGGMQQPLWRQTRYIFTEGSREETRGWGINVQFLSAGDCLLLCGDDVVMVL